MSQRQKSSSNTFNAVFFGATGGCTLACLSATLSGINTTSPSQTHIRALVRTPQKLTDALIARNVPQEAINKHLTVLKGDVKDRQSVEEVLSFPAQQSVDLIISGIGGAPKITWNPLRPFSLTDPTICADATRSILSALRSVQGEQGSRAGAKKPLFVCVSTTGISAKQRDVSILFWAFYHWALAVPHEDKRDMEQQLDALMNSREEERTLSGAVVLRPSLLLDGPAKRGDSIRVGWEWSPSVQADSKEPGPAIGYTITRDSVGTWLHDQIIAGCERDEAGRREVREKWSGKMVTLTE